MTGTPLPVTEPAPLTMLTVRLAGLLAVTWVVVLSILTLTANPVQVSLAQLHAADSVVTARRAGETQLEVEKVWSGSIKPGIVTVTNLERVRFPAGSRFVVPLSHVKSWWTVTTLGSQRQPPIVYPATPDVQNAVRRALPPQAK